MTLEDRIKRIKEEASNGNSPGKRIGELCDVLVDFVRKSRPPEQPRLFNQQLTSEQKRGFPIHDRPVTPGQE